jgi:hypothetical protein
MPENRRDRRQRDGRAQQPGGGAVAQQAGARLQIGHPSNAERCCGHLVDRRVVGQLRVWRLATQEHVLIAALGSLVQDVVGELGDHQRRQWQGQRIVGLLLDNHDRACPPVDVGQAQRDEAAARS